MAKPKLALLPAAQGTSLYSVLPSSGVGDFDFTRSGSATRINSQGLIETVGNGVSRLNYPLLDGKVVGCPHHILEPQRTNLITYSEDFESYFNVTEITLNSNYAISPDGTLNANKITFPSSSNSMYKSGLSLSGIHTISFYVKGEGANIGKTFDVDITGTSVSQNIDVTLTNEWVRFEAQTDGLTLLQITNRSSTTIGTGSLILFGFQIEAGSYPTSYIPTNGSIVTRNAETATGSGDAATFNDSEGVLMFEVKVNEDSINKRLSISNGSTSQRVVLWFNSNNTTINAFINGGETVNMLYVVQNLQEQNKYAFKYKENDCSLWVNGIKVVTDLTATMPSGLSELAFDDGVGGLPFYGNTKQVQYYDSALTDSELETLTSWVSFSDMANGQLYTIE